MFVDPDDGSTAWMVAPFEVCLSPFWIDWIGVSTPLFCDYFQLESENPQGMQNVINGTQMLRVPNVPAVRIHANCAGTSFVGRFANLSSTCYARVGAFTSSVAWNPYMTTVDASCIKSINASAPDPGPDLPSQQLPVQFQYIKNATSSVAFCYATYEVYEITAQLDVTQGRLIPQAWDQTLVPGYFDGQNFSFAQNGCVHGLCELCSESSLSHNALLSITQVWSPGRGG
jgi:hypothetical protein